MTMPFATTRNAFSTLFFGPEVLVACAGFLALGLTIPPLPAAEKVEVFEVRISQPLDVPEADPAPFFGS